MTSGRTQDISKMAAYTKNFVFTLNNPDAAEAIALENHENITYIVYGVEEGESGTKHLQGYVQFDHKVRLEWIKKHVNARAHWEVRRGNHSQARHYCICNAEPKCAKKKDEKNGFTKCKNIKRETNTGETGTFVEKGTATQQGERTDLDAVRQQVLEEGMRGVVAIRSLQQMQVAAKFLTYHEEARNWKPTVTWICGPSGAGKSRKAREMLGTEDVYEKKTGTKWWEGYDGHSKVIIDDFRDSWWSMTMMLSILDRYSHPLECKGGCRQLLAKEIVVTSIEHPSKMYRGTSTEPIEQLIRRIDNIIDLSPTDAERLQSLHRIRDITNQSIGTQDTTPVISQISESQIQLAASAGSWTDDYNSSQDSEMNESQHVRRA